MCREEAERCRQRVEMMGRIGEKRARAVGRREQELCMYRIEFDAFIDRNERAIGRQSRKLRDAGSRWGDWVVG